MESQKNSFLPSKSLRQTASASASSSSSSSSSPPPSPSPSPSPSPPPPSIESSYILRESLSKISSMKNTFSLKAGKKSSSKKGSFSLNRPTVEIAFNENDYDIKFNYLLMCINNLEKLELINTELLYNIYIGIKDSMNSSFSNYSSNCMPFQDEDKIIFKYDGFFVLNQVINKFMVPLSNDKEDDDGSLINDLYILCLLYLLGGNRIEQLMNNIYSPVNQTIEGIYFKYIEKSFGCNLYTENKLTLTRIANTFPHICCELYANQIIEPILAKDIIGLLIDDISTVIYCPLFPLVATKLLFKFKENILPQLLWITVQNNNNDIITIYDDPSIDKSSLIKSSNYNFECNSNSLSSDNKNEIDDYIINLWYRVKRDIITSYLPEKIKIEKCLKWKLIDIDGKPELFWSMSRKLCLYYLDEQFSESSVWPYLRGEIQSFFIPDDNNSEE